MDIQEEIEKLKAKKVEIVSRLNLTLDITEKEELQEKLDTIEKQIKVLENLSH